MLDLLQDLNQTVIPKAMERIQEVKLPKINIPIFSGNYNDWATFQDLYISLIHANTALSNVQKMHYLKGSVAGEAEQLLKHIQVTDKNYDLAWNTLKRRYNNKRIIINTIFNRFLGHKRLSNDTSMGIKELLDTAKECLNSLRNLDVDIQGWDPLVIHLIVNKLDINTHQYWEEELNSLPIDELPALERLFLFLEKRFRVLEMMQLSHYGNNSRNVTTKSFYSVSESANIVCIYCNGDHNLQLCNDFGMLGIDQKLEVVQSHRLCFNCLWPGHMVRDCRYTSKCRTCKRRHHTLLHNSKNSNESVHEDEPTPGQIDILLGVNIYTEIMMSGFVKGDRGAPMAQQTRLGWILSGGALNSFRENQRNLVSMHVCVNFERRLWSIWEKKTLKDKTRGEGFMKEKEPIQETEILKIGSEKKSVETLGIQSKINEGNFRTPQRNEFYKNITKRTVLSQKISRFHPLGWLIPCILIVKLFVQELWSKKFSRHENLNLFNHVSKELITFSKSISILSKVKINRWVGYTKRNIIEGYIVADVAQVAYLAVVYGRIKDYATGIIVPAKQLSLLILKQFAAVLPLKLF